MVTFEQKHFLVHTLLDAEPCFLLNRCIIVESQTNDVQKPVPFK